MVWGELGTGMRTSGKRRAGTFGEGCNHSPPSSQVHAGPITYDSLYNGEHFDGALSSFLQGWTLPLYNQSGWLPASPANSVANSAALSSRLFEPIRHLNALPPRSTTSPSPGVQVFDFGQNMAGVVRLKRLACPAGFSVKLRHAELLTHPPYGERDGSIYVGNLRGAKATDVYTCSGVEGLGEGEESGESYIPTFTQHGFRYVEVSGLPAPLSEEQVEGVEMHTALRQHSSVLFASPLLNKIQHATLWSQKSNVMSVFSCPSPHSTRERATFSSPLASTTPHPPFMVAACRFPCLNLSHVQHATKRV